MLKSRDVKENVSDVLFGVDNLNFHTFELLAFFPPGLHACRNIAV